MPKAPSRRRPISTLVTSGVRRRARSPRTRRHGQRQREVRGGRVLYEGIVNQRSRKRIEWSSPRRSSPSRVLVKWVRDEARASFVYKTPSSLVNRVNRSTSMHRQSWRGTGSPLTRDLRAAYWVPAVFRPAIPSAPDTVQNRSKVERSQSLIGCWLRRIAVSWEGVIILARYFLQVGAFEGFI